jgi:hypothetical protein
MMHGHATITLTDPTTGQVTDRREEDNLVTDVIKDMMRYNPFGVRDTLANPYGLNQLLVNWVWPLATHSYGGIVLFGETNTEDAASYWPGPDNPIRGYASMDNTTFTDPMRGTYNTNESGPVAKGYRWVYDWPTDRGNGEIKSISLTHRKTGQQWYGNALYENGASNMAYAVRPLLFDGSDLESSEQRAKGKRFNDSQHQMYALKCGSCADASGVHVVSASGGSLLIDYNATETAKDALDITITTIPWTPGSFGLTGNPYTLGTPYDVKATIPGNWATHTQPSSSVSDPAQFQNLQYVGANWYGGQLHMVKWAGNQSGDATITHATITTSGNVTVETITSPVQLSGVQPGKDGLYYYAFDRGGGVIANGYLIAMGWNCERFWRIPLADPSHPVEIPLPPAYTAQQFRDGVTSSSKAWKLDAGMPGTPIILWLNDGFECWRLRGTQWTRTINGYNNIQDAARPMINPYNADMPGARYYAPCKPYRIGPYLCGITTNSDGACTLGAGLDLRYLGTVNNLTDPVTKTSDRTMKITYTLTEA